MEVKVAVTETLLVSVTVHAPVPVQAPDQPANVELAFAAAVSVTMVPLPKLALHTAPQLILAGLLVIVPAPVPAVLTVSCTGGALEVKLAVTEVALATVTLQLPLPLQPPDQPANVELAFGAAVSVTTVPLLNVALHIAPQLIPAGLLVIVPAPVPMLWTVIGKELASGGGLAALLVEPQPQRMNERKARQERHKNIFKVDIDPGNSMAPVAEHINSPDGKTATNFITRS